MEKVAIRILPNGLKSVIIFSLNKNMNNNSKGNVHFFLLIIVVIIAFTGIGYWAYKNGQIKILQPNPSQTINLNQTDYWKTYRNENWGFEVSYPPNWTYIESSWEGGENETSVDYDGIHLSPPNTIRDNTSVNVFKVKNDGLSIKDYFNKNDYSCCGDFVEPTYLGNEIIASEKITVNGVEGRKFLKAPEDIPVDGVTANWVVLETNGKIYLISYYKDEKETTFDIERVFNQILSTFKFLDSGIISGTVTENRLDCRIDGLCYLLVDTGSKTVRVIYHYGEWPPCINNTAAQMGEEIKIGDIIEIYGESKDIDKISTCDSEEYYIRKI
ncbi:hypothetical protein A3D01_01205 [Candidatus Woesebacteria bacterium RIFCSPHIGHO2_02_FULL_39_13]|uniref:Uncharacterized protein n=1 Tax=Candidatus Woesebacteria bacterium RIFCSPHIGHO2_02_FULL_39_13 TaxID=1802505 RepID=A0A1F7Z269_9BACT|nr:MAG: hypothetical protein A3D01_01205 [Candidatus Woesebacteria bacterium RIFCSPHIGHO2_02_FULL_39_13]OGM71689.1 MAG: hypothetical protein A3H19_01575 [Candidatus Woesebacteria bacterium RIFCSPLOWO2_12_FULL_39_9]